MLDVVQSFRAQAEAQARELIHAIAAAEGVIISSIERECEALRAGQMLAADALRLRLHDATRLYLNLIRATRASIRTIEQVLPGTCDHLEERRLAFANLLKVEFAVLATERAAARRPRTAKPVAPAEPIPLARFAHRRRARRRESIAG